MSKPTGMAPAFLSNIQLLKPIPYSCKSCNKLLLWEQKGDVPKYCDPCYHRLKGKEATHRPIWMTTEVTNEGSFLERIDAIVHFSPQAQQWYIKEPDRWVKAAEIEIERAFSWLWWKDRPKPSSEHRQDEVELWQKEMQNLKNLCIDRVEINKPYKGK